MVDAGTFIYYNAYELLRYSVTIAILKIFGFANLFCKLLHYTKNPGNCNLLQSPGRNIFVPRYHPHSAFFHESPLESLQQDSGL